MMRSARDTAHVVFTDYLKVRKKEVITLIFEGQECPSYYIHKIRIIVGEIPLKQLIARGKKNVLDLRKLIQRNIETSHDKTLYFVDRDYDKSPAPGDFKDTYVTRGYSIENEVFSWSVIESFLRSHFDIATAEDETAIENAKQMFEETTSSYLDATRVIQKIIFTCRRNNIKCTTGREIGDYFTINWRTLTVTPKFESESELMTHLCVNAEDHQEILRLITEENEFESLNKSTQWRGKYHLSFLKSLLVNLASKRRKGEHPFLRASRVGVEPNHPSLFPTLSINTPLPGCLVEFMKAYNLES